MLKCPPNKDLLKRMPTRHLKSWEEMAQQRLSSHKHGTTVLLATKGCVWWLAKESEREACHKHDVVAL